MGTLPRVRVTNADTYTKDDSTMILPSFVNMGLARNNLCEFYWTNIGMIFFKYYLEEVLVIVDETGLTL